MLIRILLAAILLSTSAAGAAEVSKPWSQPTVSLEIDDPSGAKTTYTDVPWSTGLTVLNVMQMIDGPTFSAKWSRSVGGWMITEINGVAADSSNGKSWLLCVGGYEAGVGASSYMLGAGSAAKWVYSTYPPNCT